MVLQAKALIAGLVLAGAGIAALSSGEAKAAEPKDNEPKPKGEQPGAKDKSGGTKPATSKASTSSAGKKTPSGVDPAHLAAQTSDALMKNDLTRLRALVKDWKSAGDKITSDDLSELTEGAASGEDFPKWDGDGTKGSPMVRAWGLHVLTFELRPEKLLLWSDEWKSGLPILAAALKTKANAIFVDPSKGTSDDPQPDADTLRRILETVEVGDPIALRKLADELEKAGFAEAAADLRAMADLITSGKEKPPVIEKPAPPPKPEAHEPQHDTTEPQPAPRPKTETPAKPAGGSGRIVIVKKGEGPFQVTQRLLGKSEGGRFKELVKENIPPKKSDGKGGFTSLNAGDKLKVPASWPAHPDAIRGTIDVATPAPVKNPELRPAPTSDRFVVVKKGEGPFQITQRVLGKNEGARFKELVKENIPPKKSDGKGGFTSLNPGEKLKVPASWPSSSEIVLGGDSDDEMSFGADAAMPLNSRQAEAGKIALQANFGRLDPDLLAEWQRREGIPQTGVYDCGSAYVLCFRFGICPPVPNFQNKGQLAQFIGQMRAAARKDPQRADEFLSKAREASGKAA